jgi:ABC-type multidrug transport system ATPase subunit
MKNPDNNLVNSKKNEVLIRVEHVSKRFLSNWIFQNVNLELKQADKIVVQGANGSGKSTLLQLIAGFQAPTKGSITYSMNGEKLDNEFQYQQISIAAPYLELIEDFSFYESIQHQRQFKPFLQNISTDEIIELSELGKQNALKPIRVCSSGMKQRMKLTLAMLADCPVLLLDEPCSNLDKGATEWYKTFIKNYCLHKTIVVCSNDQKDEFSFCNNTIDIENFKKTSQ